MLRAARWLGSVPTLRLQLDPEMIMTLTKTFFNASFTVL